MKLKNLLLVGAVCALAVPQAFAAENDKPKNEQKPVFEHPLRGPEISHAERNNDMPFMHEPCPFCDQDLLECGNMGMSKNEKWNKKNKKNKKDWKAFHKQFRQMPGGMFQGMKNVKNQSDDDILSMVKEADSAFAKKLKSMKEESPEQYKRALMALHFKLFFIKDKKNDKEKELISKVVASVSLETEVRELELKYRKAPKEEKEASKAELKASLEKLFDLRIEEQQSRLKKMEENIAEQKEKLNAKKASKDRIVESRLEEISGEKFRW